MTETTFGSEKNPKKTIGMGKSL